MNKEHAVKWAGTPDGAARLLALVERWEREGYEPEVSVTKRGNLHVQLRLDRPVDGAADDGWIPPTEPDPFDDPVAK